MGTKFDGKVILVAGGTGGLGRAVALAFLEQGAKVVVTYRVAEELDALKSAAGKNGSRARLVKKCANRTRVATSLLYIRSGSDSKGSLTMASCSL